VRGMKDEDIAREQMIESGAARAQTEIDLDAVIAAEGGAVERAHRRNAVAVEIQARAVHCRKELSLPSVGVREQSIERGNRVAAWQRISRTWQRVGRDAYCIREGTDHTHAACTGVSREAVEPIAGNDGVGLQHDLVAIAMLCERPIDGGG